MDKEQIKMLYQPTHKNFSIVTVPKIKFAMIDGKGNPQDKEYSLAMQWLFLTIHPVKLEAKKRMGKDFIGAPPECLLWADDMDDLINGNKDKWKWRIMIVLPEWANDEIFEEGVTKAAEKLGDRPKTLRMEMFDEGKSVQIMHIGDYAQVAPIIAQMYGEFIPDNNYVENGYYHEIYLNDPRRVAPEKRKMVVRQPIKHKEKENG